MIGLKTNGVYVMGATKEINKALKERKVTRTKTLTTTTLVFVVNEFEVLKKRFYATSLMTPQAPWFVCSVGEIAPPTEQTLRFATEQDLIDFITIIFYASQGFLHLNFEIADLKHVLTEKRDVSIQSVEEKDFHTISKDANVFCFCFSDGGFMESDRLFQKLTKEMELSATKIYLAGSFHCPYSMIRCFTL